MQENNWVITTKKKGKGKLPIFCDNGERVITVYGPECTENRLNAKTDNLLCSIREVKQCFRSYIQKYHNW